ncbi:conserved hypothetical protein, partial [Ricinus communis]
LECLYAIGCVKHASLTKNKLFFHDNSRDYKGRGSKLSINNRGAVLLCQRHKQGVYFVNATKDRGERNSVEARRGAY